MEFKPSKEHDYIQANIAFILRNAQWRNRTAKETQFANNERMKEIGLNPDSNCLQVYFEKGIANNVFVKEAKFQEGEASKEFRELAKLQSFSFSL